ncbi:MAG TPA: endonuclease domain-containing protein [Williamwhitmania sp.]|nr:endonuclease domain-containing protein [Williamwhitmania sp.]
MKSSFSMYCNATDSTIAMARELRQRPTEAEKILWQALRQKRLGYRFRRQHPIDRFIADFYCHPLRLIIEVDGGYHNSLSQREHDEDRSYEIMLNYDLKVIRFTNEQVMQDLLQVVARIQLEIAGRERYIMT